jgi:hypothetical protein
MKDPRFLYRLAIFDYKTKFLTAGGLFVGFADDVLKEGGPEIINMEEQVLIKTAPDSQAIVRRYQIREAAIPAWLPSFFWPDYMNNQGVRLICFALLESPKRGSLPEFKRKLREDFIRFGRLTDEQKNALFRWDREGRRYFGLALDKGE